MHENKIPKAIRRIIRELSLKAYEAELREHLGALYKNFQDWDNNELKSGELSDLIHNFHHGPSREMYNFYNTVKPEMAVGRAIVFEYLSLEQIPKEVHSYIANSIEYFKEDYES